MSKFNKEQKIEIYRKPQFSPINVILAIYLLLVNILLRYYFVNPMSQDEHRRLESRKV